MYVQPLQPECWHVAAYRAALVLLPALDKPAWSDFAGKPLFPWVCFGHRLCVLGWLQSAVTGFLFQPHSFPLCAQKPSRGGAVNSEHLEICVKFMFMFHILMVSVFHCQWSAKALQERDCSPLPAYSRVGSVTFVLLKGFPGMDSWDAI